MPVAANVDVLAPSFIEIPEHRLHAIACSLVEDENTDHPAQNKPWTVWPFQQVQNGNGPSGAVTLRFRVNWLKDEVPPATLTHGLVGPLKVGKYSCQVLARSYSFSTFEMLASGRADPLFQIAFQRPTFFKSSRKIVAWPDASLIIRSLALKWNLYCEPSLRLSRDLVGELQRATSVTILERCRERVSVRGRPDRSGFVGSVVLELATASADLAGPFSALMRAMPYFGVGAETTYGFGVAIAKPLSPALL